MKNNLAPTVPQIIRFRHRQRLQASRNPAGRLALSCSAVLSLLAVLGITGLVFTFAILTRDLPSLETLPALLEPPNGSLLQPTRLYDRTGEHLLLTLENPAARDKPYLKILPSSLISATIASQDPSFLNNAGFSAGSLVGSGQPALAQRLVSDLLFQDEPAGFRRSLREALLASQVTGYYGREQVLEWYLNSAPYGNLAYGAEAAARVYFGKPAAQLSLAESAWLAAAAQSPDTILLSAPQAALERQKAIIQAMQDQGWIDANQAGQALQERLKFQKARQPEANPAPAFTNLVLEQLSSQVGRKSLERGGYRVITSLDYDLQLQANCATTEQIGRLNASQARPVASAPECPAASLLPSLPAGSSAVPGAGANLVVMDPKNGQILAMVGDASAGLDPAHLPGHAPGTLLSPFVYLTAFARGLSPASLVWDVPGRLPGSNLQNFDGAYHGPMRLRMALANDYLAPTAELLAQVGPENAWETAQQMGALSPLAFQDEKDLGLLQDGGEVTLLDACRAFAVLANQGTMTGLGLPSNSPGEDLSPLQPATILRVEDSSGQETLLDWSMPQSRPLINPQLSYLLTDVLRDESARWPSLGHPNSLEIGRPVAVKTGRTVSERDAWTVGYTPQLVAGVWVGFRTGEPGGRVTPAVSSALWHAITQYAHRALPPDTWPTPPGITSLDVCDPSGMLPTANCPSIVKEIFLSGNEPAHEDDLYRSLEVNRETGRLATIFTPGELVEDHVYMIVPPEAEDWARQAGFNLPPDSYDAIDPPSPTGQNVRVALPEMFAPLKGQVRVSGTAGGAGFAYYRLQVGKGLNPQEWVQIGQDISQPVTNGLLGVWDSTGLSGLYALQLQVVSKDQKIDNATILVTVDNQPPEVAILYPAEGQTIVLNQLRPVTLRVSSSDDLGLARLEFHVDREPVINVDQPPYILSWQARPGTHTLKVKAIDRSGNSEEKTIHFTIQ